MDKASALVKENSPEHRDDLFLAVKELKGARAKALAVYAGSSYVKASCVGSRAKGGTDTCAYKTPETKTCTSCKKGTSQQSKPKKPNQKHPPSAIGKLQS